MGENAFVQENADVHKALEENTVIRVNCHFVFKCMEDKMQSEL